MDSIKGAVAGAADTLTDAAQATKEGLTGTQQSLQENKAAALQNVDEVGQRLL